MEIFYNKNMTPIMLHITENGNFKKTIYMKSRAQAVRYLREQGCTVREESTCKLNGNSVFFTHGVTVYEMEEDSIKNGERR